MRVNEYIYAIYPAQSLALAFVENAWWQCCSEQGTTENLSPIFSSLHSVVFLKRNTKKIRPMSTLYIFRPGPEPQDAPLALDCSETTWNQSGHGTCSPARPPFRKRLSGSGTGDNLGRELLSSGRKPCPRLILLRRLWKGVRLQPVENRLHWPFLAPTNGRLFPWRWAGGGGAGTR